VRERENNESVRDRDRGKHEGCRDRKVWWREKGRKKKGLPG
jgi:hypothetical protein